MRPLRRHRGWETSEASPPSLTGLAAGCGTHLWIDQGPSCCHPYAGRPDRTTASSALVGPLREALGPEAFAVAHYEVRSETKEEGVAYAGGMT